MELLAEELKLETNGLSTFKSIFSKSKVQYTGCSCDEGTFMVYVLHLGMMNLVAVVVGDLVDLEDRIVPMRKGSAFTRPFTFL